ncbi:MAG: hypothetical protein OEU44_04550 [Gammaproteobacteria bacterium]|nr:hypothetical protein [Gammaproteobacteria bacterium]
MQPYYLKLSIAVVIAGLLGLLAWWVYDFGKLHGVTELASLREKYALLVQQNEQVVEVNSNLREQVAILERSSQIDRQATEEVQDELGALQEELHAARDEIEFYRGIVSPGNGKPGLRIHRFTLSAERQSRNFDYDLVLTQLKKNERYVTGQVGWTISGKREGVSEELDLAAVSEIGVAHLDFRFRYFQRLTGVISLPEGFHAEEVALSIKTTGKNAPEPLLQVFNWPDAEPEDGR